MSRIKHISRNMGSTIFTQIPLFLFSFIVRRVFIYALGEQYLGLNGLFANILSVLSVAELGFGASITYSLYHPLATGDHEKVKSLMRLYRKVYVALGVLILVVGASLTPYLRFFVREMPKDIAHIELVYLLCVVDSGISYFFSYKAALLFADQKKYVETVVRMAVKLVCNVVQLVLLLAFRNYILYMACQVASTVASNVWVALSADKNYPYLREKDVQPLSEEDRDTIKRNVGAMALHRFGSVVVFSTDNLLIAKLVSLASVGFYSNYLMVTDALHRIINRLYQDMMASMGHLNAIESQERKIRAFNNQNFLSAWLFGFCAICLYHLYNPFIALWLGEHYLFPRSTVTVIVLNFYISAMRKPVVNTKEVMGLFWNDRFAPLVEAALNLLLSIALARPFGVAGILMGTLFSTLLVPFWVQPVVLYESGLDANPLSYFIRFGVYTAITALAGAVTGFFCGLMPGGVFGFLGKMALCLTVPNGIFFLIYRRTEEFQYLRLVGAKVTRKLLRRGK